MQTAREMWWLHWQEFMDGAGEDGVVLISLGTLAQFGVFLPSIFQFPNNFTQSVKLQVYSNQQLSCCSSSKVCSYCSEAGDRDCLGADMRFHGVCG